MRVETYWGNYDESVPNGSGWNDGCHDRSIDGAGHGYSRDRWSNRPEECVGQRRPDGYSDRHEGGPRLHVACVLDSLHGADADRVDQDLGDEGRDWA